MPKGPSPSSPIRVPHPWLDAAVIFATGAASWRTETADLAQQLNRPVPLGCRCLIVPSAPHSGSRTIAHQIAGILTRSRTLPGLLLDASPNAEESIPVWHTVEGAAAPASAIETHTLVGTGKDGLLGQLRLPEWFGERPAAWDDARTKLFRFYDTVTTHAGPLDQNSLVASAGQVHAIVLVSPANRGDVESGRDLLGKVQAEIDNRGPSLRSPHRPRLLHAVVAKQPGPVLVPRLQPEEHLVPYDTVLAQTTAYHTKAPGLLSRRTGTAIARLAAAIVSAAASEVRA
ncbi:hypothetical protein [Actinomyces trachealis]|uniref:hypothetical protein n=1 Tax=Actinomyces trachealis TaxID=2763540 RepID=UPI001892D04B|nr:hypothetical protein [Actinomyces trachealis]